MPVRRLRHTMKIMWILNLLPQKTRFGASKMTVAAESSLTPDDLRSEAIFKVTYLCNQETLRDKEGGALNLICLSVL